MQQIHNRCQHVLGSIRDPACSANFLGNYPNTATFIDVCLRLYESKSKANRCAHLLVLRGMHTYSASTRIRMVPN